MKIVVVDGNTANPGDVSWGRLQALGELVVYARTPPELVFQRVEEAGAVITNKVVIDRPLLERLSRLRYIGVSATGYNVVDLEAARAREVVVTNVPDYCTASVAQLVFAHLLELTRHVAAHARGVGDGRWSGSADFCYWDTPQVSLEGRVMGLVGYGAIGRAVGGIARAFGMEVLTVLRQSREVPGARVVDLDELLGASDVVSLHCPLTEQTRAVIDAEALRMMKPSAFLINAARGPLIRETDLARALHERWIAGAGLDVLSVEPPSPQNPLLTAPNCLITPHIGWAAREARQRLLDACADNLEAFIAGTPRNVVC